MSYNPIPTGTAGTPSTQVLTVQGITSATPQPISNSDSGLTTGSITVVDSASTSSSGMFGSSIVTGSPTANSFVSITTLGYTGVSITISGTWTGTLTTEVSEDGGTTWASRGLIVSGSTQRTASFTSNAIGSGEAGASTNFRIRATAAVTGTANISMKAGIATATVKLINGATIADNSSGASATVKPASTAPTSTDTGLVVSKHPLSAGLGSVSAGTAATVSELTGGVYNSSTPSLSNGQQIAIQLDTAGNQLVNVQSTVGNRSFEISTTITRPANTTTYAIGQVISTATSGLTAFPTFSLGIGNSQMFFINSIRVASTNGAAALKLQPSLSLFNTASPSGGGFNDASAFNPTAAALMAAGNVFFENVPNTVPIGSTASFMIKGDEYYREGKTDSSGNVYIALVAQNAYIPASGEVLTIGIKGVY